MTSEQHTRFLNYLELKPYFLRRQDAALDAAAFAERDAEFTELLERERRGECSASDASRISALRRMLLRD